MSKYCGSGLKIDLYVVVVVVVVVAVVILVVVTKLLSNLTAFSRFKFNVINIFPKVIYA